MKFIQIIHLDCSSLDKKREQKLLDAFSRTDKNQTLALVRQLCRYRRHPSPSLRFFSLCSLPCGVTLCRYARSSVYDGTHQLSRLVLDGEGNRLSMEQRRDIRCDRYGEGRFLGPKIVVRFDFPLQTCGSFSSVTARVQARRLLHHGSTILCRGGASGGVV